VSRRIALFSSLFVLTACAAAPPEGEDAGDSSDAGSASVSTVCSAFPVTVTLSATNDATLKNGLLCYGATQCHFTTNMGIDGAGACQIGDRFAKFTTGTKNDVDLASSGGFEFESASAGDIHATKTYLDNVPTGPPANVVAHEGEDRQQFLFPFVTGEQVTLTSFGDP